jgi:putative Holliday junction resolvase
VGRILAVDPGSRRVGLAISDPTGTIASPLATVPAEPADSLPHRLARVARDQEAERVVVGLPRNMDGTRGRAAAAAQRLAGRLRVATGLPVETADERLTTVAAERSLISSGARRATRQQVVDQVAATLLLQGYLDHAKSTKRAG